jgi:ATP-dependent RNA helicase RhlE
MFVATAEKPKLLKRILDDRTMERVLVFTRTKHGADKVVRGLAQGGTEAAAIHGNKSQPQRERALAAFKKGGIRVLVATDIAARGIHVENVTHVVNYDLPNVPESYVHRIGRTARAGAEGIAISFCNGEERAYLKDIEKLTRMAVPVAALPEGIAAGVEAPAPQGEPKSARGRQGRRGDKQAAPHKGKPGNGRNGANRKGGGRGGEGRRSEKRERYSGLDPKTGLPGFLSRPTRRETDRAEA